MIRLLFNPISQSDFRSFAIQANKIPKMLDFNDVDFSQSNDSKKLDIYTYRSYVTVRKRLGNRFELVSGLVPSYRDYVYSVER